jgi:hypothetical protein
LHTRSSVFFALSETNGSAIGGIDPDAGMVAVEELDRGLVGLTIVSAATEQRKKYDKILQYWGGEGNSLDTSDELCKKAMMDQCSQ